MPRMASSHQWQPAPPAHGGQICSLCCTCCSQALLLKIFHGRQGLQHKVVLPNQTLAASVGLSPVVVLSLCFSAVSGHRSLGNILCPVCTNVNDTTKGEQEPIGLPESLSYYQTSGYRSLNQNQFVTTAKKKGNPNRQCFHPASEHLWEIFTGQTIL